MIYTSDNQSESTTSDWLSLTDCLLVKRTNITFVRFVNRFTGLRTGTTKREGFVVCPFYGTFVVFGFSFVLSVLNGPPSLRSGCPDLLCRTPGCVRHVNVGR